MIGATLAGCGTDVAALAEPPPEPTIWAEGADPAGRDYNTRHGECEQAAAALRAAQADESP